MKTNLLFIFFILFASIINAQTDTIKNSTSRDSSEIKMKSQSMGLCTFDLLAGSNTAAITGLIGAIYDANKNNKDRPYYETLRDGLIEITDEVLKGSTLFQYIPAKKLRYEQTDKPQHLDTLARSNGLFVCLSAKSGLGICVGWNKKVNITTIWEVVTQSGYKVKIKTYSASQDTYGKFPDTGDPALKPVWIELQKENTGQFLEELEKTIKTDTYLQ